MSGPAFDEPPVHPCKNHPMRESIEPHAYRHCAECHQHAIDGYADYHIKRSKDWRYSYDSRDDMTPDGRNIRTWTEGHAALTRIAKEKPE